MKYKMDRKFLKYFVDNSKIYKKFCSSRRSGEKELDKSKTDAKIKGKILSSRRGASRVLYTQRKR